MHDLNGKVALATGAGGRCGIDRATANAVAARIGLLLWAGVIAGLAAAACVGASAPTDTISAGSSHTCGVRANGSVACWGQNEFGQARPPGGEFRRVSAGE